MLQSVAVGDLDGEAGARVEFEDHRPVHAVQHEVHADVAQAGQLVAARGHVQQFVPARDVEADDAALGVRMLADDLRAPDAALGGAGGDVDADADRALVQVGLAVRQPRRQADHCHHRVAEENDDPAKRTGLETLVSEFTLGKTEIIKSRIRFLNRTTGTADLFDAGTGIEELQPSEVLDRKIENDYLDENTARMLKEAFAELLEEVLHKQNE